MSFNGKLNYNDTNGCSNNMDPSGHNFSSLRVRFRMITKSNATQHHNFRARIYSHVTTGISSYSASNYSSLNNLTCSNEYSSSTRNLNTPFILHENSPPRMPSTPTSIPMNYQNLKSLEFNHQKSNDSVYYQRETRTTSFYNLNKSNRNPQVLPINYGKSTTNSTTKTFRLTDDPKSSIQLDIKLKPSFDIRDNRLDPSGSRADDSLNMHRSSSCDIQSNRIDYLYPHNQNEEQNKLPQKNFDFRIDQNKMFEFKIKPILNMEKSDCSNSTTNSSLLRLSVNKSIDDDARGDEAERSSSSYLLNNKSSTCSSPFTFIETYSTRRRNSSLNNHYDSNKARILILFY